MTQTNSKLKRLLDYEETKERCKPIRNLNALLKEVESINEGWTPREVARHNLRLTAEKRAMPTNHYGMGEALNLVWAMKTTWFIIITIIFIT